MSSLEEIHNLESDCENAIDQKKNYPIKDLHTLVDKAGFEFKKRGRTGHDYIYKHPTHVLQTGTGYNDLVNLQPDKKNTSKAKPYQVEQVVKFIREAKPKDS